MTTFYDTDAQTLDGASAKIFINSGPVIVDRGGKFLLHKSGSKGTWQFTGGRLNDEFSPRSNAAFRHAQDLGTEIKFAEGAPPHVIFGTIEREGGEAHIVLIHYLASLADESQKMRGEYKWFTLDEITALDSKKETSSPNVLLACQHFSKRK